MSKQKVDFTDYLNTPTQEAYRLLSANLGLNKKILKVIAIMSFNPGEGKTTVAINLAIAGAKSGTKVLYVDADLRKPRLLKRHGGQMGLTDFTDKIDLQDVICQTGIENLDFVSSGNGFVDPVEFLSSEIFERFVEAVSSRYDKVIVDSTSLGECVDSAIIASKASGVLIVTRSQKTKFRNIEYIKWQMKNVGASIIGIVINRVEKRDFKSYFVLSNNEKYIIKNLKQFKLNT